MRTPSAPDANRDEPRTLKFCYDPCRQAHTIWKLSYAERERKETLILEIRDGLGGEAEIEALRNYGAKFIEAPMVDGWINLVLGAHYLVHDTPMVRALILALRQRATKIGLIEVGNDVREVYANEPGAALFAVSRTIEDVRTALGDQKIRSAQIGDKRLW